MSKKYYSLKGGDMKRDLEYIIRMIKQADESYKKKDYMKSKGLYYAAMKQLELLL